MKPLIVEIQTAESRERIQPNKNNPAQPWHFYEQSALLHGLVTHGTQIEAPVAFVFNTPKGQPYPVGRYYISPEHYEIDRFGRLVTQRNLKLIPVSVAAVQPKAA